MKTTKDRMVPLVPVPSDIDIVQSVMPVPISQIAEENGILPSEYDLYGTKKAKVS
jgi:formyltetrahydrofolate synthetase